MLHLFNLIIDKIISESVNFIWKIKQQKKNLLVT